jgi:hypothetical protein
LPISTGMESMSLMSKPPACARVFVRYEPSCAGCLPLISVH